MEKKGTILEAVKMVILQFIRGTNWETIIDSTDNRKAFKQVYMGYPLFSFVYDVTIDVLGEKVSHLYWGASDVQTTQTNFSAKTTQHIFKEIFDRIPIGASMGLSAFEQAMIDYGIEVPTYTIFSDTDGNIYDSYLCFETRDTHSIVEQLCTAELYHLVKSGRVIKRCERCGKLFAPNRANEKYCIRKSKEYPGKSCGDAAVYEKKLQREHTKPSARLYKSINTMLSKRAKDAIPSEKEQAENTLFYFRDSAVEWKKRLNAGEIQECEYIEWLNSFKKRRQK